MIEPHSEAIVSTSLPKHLYDQLCIIEPFQARSGKKFLCASSLVRAKPGFTACKILNPTDSVIWLSKRRPSAFIEQVDNYNIFDALSISNQSPDVPVTPSFADLLPHPSLPCSSTFSSPDSFQRLSDIESASTQSPYAPLSTAFKRHTDMHT